MATGLSKDEKKGWRHRLSDVALKRLYVWLAFVPPLIAGVFFFSAWAVGWDLTDPKSPQDLYALAGLIANVILLSVAVRGLGALVLTRRAALDQITRDARAISIQRAEEFAGRIMTLTHPFMNALVAAKAPAFLVPGESLNFDDKSPALLERAKSWTQAVGDEGRWHAIGLLNALEAWSMYFVNELADGPVAFGPCAPYYCQLVLHLYPYLIELRAKETSGNYPNLVRLWEAWYSELNEEKDGMFLEDLKQRAKENPPRRAKRLPPPKGTDLDG